jgi:hypothetical protein
MLLIPQADAAKAWQMRTSRGKDEPFQLMANLFQYTIDKEQYRPKGETFAIIPDPKVKATRTVRVARLKYTGNWDPEPGGWARLSAALHNVDKVDLDVQPITLGEGKLTNSFAIATLTGTDRLTPFTEPQRAELKKFVAGGGRLLVDAAGGSSNFGESAKSELGLLFPEEAKQLAAPLPPEDALFKLSNPSDEPLKKPYRNFARKLGAPMSEPQVAGIRTGGQLKVLFSTYDLSASLVGQPTDGIRGYTPAAGTEIVRRFVLALAK